MYFFQWPGRLAPSSLEATTFFGFFSRAFQWPGPYPHPPLSGWATKNISLWLPLEVQFFQCRIHKWTILPVQCEAVMPPIVVAAEPDPPRRIRIRAATSLLSVPDPTCRLTGMEPSSPKTINQLETRIKQRQRNVSLQYIYWATQYSCSDRNSEYFFCFLIKRNKKRTNCYCLISKYNILSYLFL